MNTESFLKQRLICVAVIDQPDDAVPLAEALLAGGLNVIEVTFRTAGAADAIARIRKSVPQILVGAGTLLTADQVKQAMDAGAQFGVSPGLSEAVSPTAHENKFPLFPGVITPTEVMRALELGWKNLKFFPAETFGGVNVLKALSRPVRPHRREIYSDRRHHGGDAAELSGDSASRGHRRFVDGRAQTRRGKSVGQNHRAHGRGDEGHCAATKILGAQALARVRAVDTFLIVKHADEPSALRFNSPPSPAAAGRGVRRSA